MTKKRRIDSAAPALISYSNGGTFKTPDSPKVHNLTPFFVALTTDEHQRTDPATQAANATELSPEAKQNLIGQSSILGATSIVTSFEKWVNSR